MIDTITQPPDLIKRIKEVLAKSWRIKPEFRRSKSEPRARGQTFRKENNALCL